MTEREAFASLQAENVRLVALLESHGIAWRETLAASQPAMTASVPEPAPTHPGPSLSTAEKVALFRRLFRGRTDVYPVRWEGKTSGKSGYAPACANEWRAGVCEKPRIKRSDCGHRLLVRLSDSVIYDHLAGKQTVGVYPLLEDDTCHFLAVDFDEADWQQDAQAFMQSCDELGVPAALEISRSGRGAQPGCSSPGVCRRAIPGAWVPPSSATPARAPGNSGWRPMTACFPTRTRCRRAGSAT